MNKYNHFYKHFFLVIIVFLMSCTNEKTPEILQPSELADEASRKIIDILANSDLAIEHKRFLFSAYVSNLIDFDAIGNNILGRTWSELGEQKKVAFKNMLQQILLYDQWLKASEFTNEEITIINSEFFGNDLANISLTLNSSKNNLSVPMVIKLKLNNDGWKIYESVLDKKEVVDQYKKEFRQIIKKEGLDKFFLILENRVRKI